MVQMPPIHPHGSYLLHTLVIIASYILMASTFTLTDIEELRNTTCHHLYKDALDNNSALDFTSPIGGLVCRPPDTYYHCLPLTDETDRYIQFCSDWIWIEPGKCPSVYSIQHAIQPYSCNEKISGCPQELYKSYNYYRYERCLKDPEPEKREEVNKTTAHSLRNIDSETVSPARTEKKEGTTGSVRVIVPVVIIVAGSFAVLGGLLYWKKRRQRNEQNDTSIPEEAGLEETRTQNENQKNDEEDEDSDDSESYVIAPESPPEEQPSPTDNRNSRGTWWNLFNLFH